MENLITVLFRDAEQIKNQVYALIFKIFPKTIRPNTHNEYGHIWQRVCSVCHCWFCLPYILLCGSHSQSFVLSNLLLWYNKNARANFIWYHVISINSRSKLSSTNSLSLTCRSLFPMGVSQQKPIFFCLKTWRKIHTEFVYFYRIIHSKLPATVKRTDLSLSLAHTNISNEAELAQLKWLDVVLLFFLVSHGNT